jgi:hypothetical protein
VFSHPSRKFHPDEVEIVARCGDRRAREVRARWKQRSDFATARGRVAQQFRDFKAFAKHDD